MAYFRSTAFTTLVFLGCSVCQANITRSDEPDVQSMDAAVLAILQSKVTSLETSVTLMKQEVTSQGETISSQQTQLINYESELNNQRGMINEQQKQIEDYQNQLDRQQTEHQKQIRNYQNEINRQQNTISLLQSQITNHWVTIEQQRKSLMITQHDLATANIKLSSLEAKADLLLNISRITTRNVSSLAIDIVDLNAEMASYQYDVTQNISILSNRTANEYCQLSNLIEAEMNKSEIQNLEISSIQNELKIQKSAFDELENNFINKSKVLQSQITTIQEKQRNEESEITSHQNTIDLHSTLLNTQINFTRTMSTDVDNMESKLALLSSNLSHVSEVLEHRPAFYAHSNDYKKVSAGQILQFESVVTNEGNGYDPSSGVFTCNFAGFYVFYQSIDSYENTYVSAHIKKNGNVIGMVQGVGTSLYDASSSSSVITELSRGDRVWLSVSSTGKTNGNNIKYGLFTSFSGFLLYTL